MRICCGEKVVEEQHLQKARCVGLRGWPGRHKDLQDVGAARASVHSVFVVGQASESLAKVFLVDPGNRFALGQAVVALYDYCGLRAVPSFELVIIGLCRVDAACRR